MVEKQGTVAEIIYHNDENYYTIAIVQNEIEEFTAVGYLPEVAAGRTFTFWGDYKIHATYGEQFAFSEYKEELPKSSEAIESFLASGAIKGIGKKMAKLIVSTFGQETLNVLEKTPNHLVKIDGIGPKKAAAIAQAYHTHREFAEVSLFFQQFGISAALAMKLYKLYGPDTIQMVKENPYQLVDDVFGIGFKKADLIAQKMGIERDSQYRIKSGIRYALWLYINEGHTYAPQKLFCENTADMLDISAESVYDTLVEMAFIGELHIENLDGRAVVFLMPYYSAEQNVCKQLIALELANLKTINGDLDRLIAIKEKETGIFLSDNQKHAVKASLQNGVSVITGGPGTGKTTIINTIIAILMQSGLKTAIAAPTGRAAKRITETSGYQASTIHRLLEYYYSEGEDTMKFGKTAEDPLEYDAVIVDEASMIDILLMNGLLNAMVPGTRLIIVGDADQLPSVGAGNVLRDILDSEIIPSVKLTEIFRQAKESLIVVNAHRINQGEFPDCNERDKDFFLLREQNEKNIVETIKGLCVKRLPAYYKNCDAMKDVQVLTPTRKGLLGSIHLNEELQSVLNPSSPTRFEKGFGNRIFREGDKVMQIRNNYELKWKKQDDFTEGQGVFNGDVGFIHTIDNEHNEVVVVYEDIKFVRYEFTQLDELELAYAVTVHKSQGSEFPIVVMPVAWFPPLLATRNLLYTAVTRGKQVVILVGSEQKMHAMIENNRIMERYSGLSVRLKGFIGRI